MATEGDVKKFVMAVSVHFPVPARDDEAVVWMSSMVHMLRDADPDVLAGAAQHILDTRHPKRDGKWFPTPAECREACVAASAKMDLARKQSDKPLLTHGQRDQSPWAGWRLDRADELISTTEMGRQAAREGWTQALHNYIRENQRLPSASEIGALKAMPRETDRLIELCDQGLGGACSSSLARLGRTIKERGADMAAHVLEGGPKAWRR